MVDLLGLGRHLQDTENIINIITCKPTVAGWMTSLGAYRVHGNVKMEEQIAKQVVKLATGSSQGGGLLSNVYAAAEGSQCKEVWRKSQVAQGFLCMIIRSVLLWKVTKTPSNNWNCCRATEADERHWLQVQYQIHDVEEKNKSCFTFSSTQEEPGRILASSAPPGIPIYSSKQPPHSSQR